MPVQPRLAWTLAIGCVLWQLMARIGQMFDNMVYLDLWSTGAAVIGLLAVAGLVALQMFVTLGRGSPLVLFVMAVLVFAPAPLVGAPWPTMCGLLGGAILLTLRAPLSWLLFASAAIADAVIGWSMSDQGVVILTSRLYVTISVAFTLFAVTRLARLIQEAHDARIETARAEAEAERLRSARKLRLNLGTPLSQLIKHVRRITTAPALSRGDIAEIAVSARHAATEARRTVAVGDPIRTDLSRLPARSLPADDYRLAWSVSILIVVVFAGIAVNNMIWEGGASAQAWVMLIVTVVVSGLLHLYHGTPRADGGSPRWWPWTLPAHAALVLVSVVLVGESLFLLLILVAGTAFTRLRTPWSWYGMIALTCCYLGLSYLTFAAWSVWTALYFGGALAVGVITIYALCNLPGVARRLHETRVELARIAIVTERLRFARDVHDLLGFHLSAIAMQADVAARTLDADRHAAREQLHELLLSSERALAEVRSINDIAGEITAATELVAARSMLEAAGLRVATDPLPRMSGEADQVAGIIIREAATNVVRHSRATYCTIRFATHDDTACVTITNDGADPAGRAPTGTHSGSGVANLSARAEAVGGRLTTRMQLDGMFVLRAHLPVDVRSAPRTDAIDHATRAPSTT